MSFYNFDKVFLTQIDNMHVAKMIASALRKEHLFESSMVKRIGMITGINLCTINKWFQSKNAPKSAHLLMLAGHYPSVLKGLLDLIGRTDLWHLCLQANIPSKMQENYHSYGYNSSAYRDKFVLINAIIDFDKAIKLNSRQLWFIGELQRGYTPNNYSIADFWKVSYRTAKRDTSTLIDHKIIRYNGSCKKGEYTLC